jgi:hypothetical protein
MASLDMTARQLLLTLPPTYIPWIDNKLILESLSPEIASLALREIQQMNGYELPVGLHSIAMSVCGEHSLNCE